MDKNWSEQLNWKVKEALDCENEAQKPSKSSKGEQGQQVDCSKVVKSLFRQLHEDYSLDVKYFAKPLGKRSENILDLVSKAFINEIGRFGSALFGIK